MIHDQAIVNYFWELCWCGWRFPNYIELADVHRVQYQEQIQHWTVEIVTQLAVRGVVVTMVIPQGRQIAAKHIRASSNDAGRGCKSDWDIVTHALQVLTIIHCSSVTWSLTNRCLFPRRLKMWCKCPGWPTNSWPVSQTVVEDARCTRGENYLMYLRSYASHLSPNSSYILLQLLEAKKTKSCRARVVHVPVIMQHCWYGWICIDTVQHLIVLNSYCWWMEKMCKLIFCVCLTHLKELVSWVMSQAFIHVHLYM